VLLRAEADYAVRRNDIDADVFVCAGAEEVGGDADSALCGFGAGVTWCAQQFALCQWPRARLSWEIMNNEDHSSIAPRGIATGLRAVHRMRPGIDREALAAAAARLHAKFAT
jgi:hypothetical protein